jgi:hypothetical protein
MGVNTDQTAVSLQNKLKSLQCKKRRHPLSVGKNPRDPQYGMLATRRPFTTERSRKCCKYRRQITVRVGAVSSGLNTYVSEPRAMVAALVRELDTGGGDTLKNSKCEVDDIDEEQKDWHVLSSRRIYKAITNQFLATATVDYEVLLERTKGE